MKLEFNLGKIITGAFFEHTELSFSLFVNTRLRYQEDASLFFEQENKMTLSFDTEKILLIPETQQDLAILNDYRRFTEVIKTQQEYLFINPKVFVQ